jgi:hypothetical protein
VGSRKKNIEYRKETKKIRSTKLEVGNEKGFRNQETRNKT